MRNVQINKQENFNLFKLLLLNEIIIIINNNKKE